MRSTSLRFNSLFVLVAGLLLALLVGGCQISVSGSADSRAFYPDQIGDKKVGDPRKASYEGSGHTERNSAGFEQMSVGGKGGGM